MMLGLVSRSLGDGDKHSSLETFLPQSYANFYRRPLYRLIACHDTAYFGCAYRMTALDACVGGMLLSAANVEPATLPNSALSIRLLTRRTSIRYYSLTSNNLTHL
jgi:hypothetical protein